MFIPSLRPLTLTSVLRLRLCPVDAMFSARLLGDNWHPRLLATSVYAGSGAVAGRGGLGVVRREEKGVRDAMNRTPE